MKKIFSLLIGLTVLITAIIPCGTAFAAEKKYGDYTYCTWWNDSKSVIIEKYNGKAKTVKIPSKIKGKPVAAIDWHAFAYNKKIKKVIIPDSIRTINGDAFVKCTNLEKIEIGNGIKEIGRDAFTGTKYAKTHKRKNGVLYIGKYLITANRKVCKGKVKVKKGTRLIACGAFIMCKKITSVTIPDSVEIINETAFEDCVRLESVRLPSGLSELSDSVFNHCKCLEKIKLPEKLKKISARAFAYSGIKEITIPKSVKRFGDNIFYNSTLEKITLPEGLKTIPNGFLSNTRIKEIEIPDSVRTIAYRAFEECKQLKGIKLPSGLKSIESDAFFETGLEEITIPDKIETISWSTFSNCYDLKSVKIGSGVKLIDYYAFNECTSLEEISIPDNVETIMPLAFYDCPKLQNIKLGNGLKEIGYDAFLGTAAAEKNEYENGIQYIDNAVYSADKGITKAELKEGTRIVVDRAFNSSSELTELTLPGSFETSIANQLDFCKKLEKISVSPDNQAFTDIDGVLYSKDKTVIVKYPRGLSGDYKIPNGVTEIGDNAFAYSKLQSIIIPDSVKRIGINAFANCMSLKAVDLGRCETIDYCAFINCKKLKDVVLPNTVKALGGYAFGLYFPRDRFDEPVYTDEAELPCSVKNFVIHGSVYGPLPNYVRNGDSGDDFSYYIQYDFTDYNAPDVTVKGGKGKISVIWKSDDTSVGFRVTYKKKGKKEVTKLFKSEKTVKKELKKLKKGTYRVWVESFIDCGCDEPHYRFSEKTEAFTVKVK